MDEFDVVEVEEPKVYSVGVYYQDFTCNVFGPKEYTFQSDKPYTEGDLVVVKDRKGYQVVKVTRCYQGYENIPYSKVVDLTEINELNRAEQRKQEVASQIRTAIVTQLENNAFDMLVSQHPDMKPLIEEYKKSGGNYSELMPTLANMKA